MARRELSPLWRMLMLVLFTSTIWVAYDAKAITPLIPRLQPITDRIQKIRTAQVVNNGLSVDSIKDFERIEFVPEQAIATTNVALDGFESQAFAMSPTHSFDCSEAMLKLKADLAIFNAGSIRIWWLHSTSPITQYDIIRILPFGSKF